MITKRIVLLANSRKLSDRCLAGREFNNGQAGAWVRPVSARPGESLNPTERQYQGNAEPQLLDVIDVPLVHANPHSCQTENWLVPENQRWIRKSSLTWNEAAQLAEVPAQLWVNGHSTIKGKNDEIPVNLAHNFQTSICMIQVEDVAIEVSALQANKRKIRAYFYYGNALYDFSVTDAAIESRYRTGPAGTANFDESLLTISLSEPFTKNGGQRCHYKLVAAIIPRSGIYPVVRA